MELKVQYQYTIKLKLSLKMNLTIYQKNNKINKELKLQIPFVYQKIIKENAKYFLNKKKKNQKIVNNNNQMMMILMIKNKIYFKIHNNIKRN